VKKKQTNQKSLKNLKPFKKGNKASVGYGRPRLPADEKLLRDADYHILADLVKSGRYEQVIRDSIDRQLKVGRIDTLKFLSERVLGSLASAIPSQTREFYPLTFMDTEGELISIGLMDDGGKVPAALKDFMDQFNESRKDKCWLGVIE